MPKEDITVTRNLREAGLLTNKDSYVSLDGHLFLEGWDKSRIRPYVFRRYKDRCVICKARLHEDAPPFHPQCGAWHHVKNCDCPGCAELRCDTTTGRPCHAHRTVGFQREATNERSAG